MTEFIMPIKKRYDTITTISEHGRSRRLILCPFCDYHFTAYIWSLAGSGKRCPYCKAFFSMEYAYKDKD